MYIAQVRSILINKKKVYKKNKTKSISTYNLNLPSKCTYKNFSKYFKVV